MAGVGQQRQHCVAGRLIARGVKPAAALTFLLAAPAINPVVMVATAVAFQSSE